MENVWGLRGIWRGCSQVEGRVGEDCQCGVRACSEGAVAGGKEVSSSDTFQLPVMRLSAFFPPACLPTLFSCLPACLPA